MIIRTLQPPTSRQPLARLTPHLPFPHTCRYATRIGPVRNSPPCDIFTLSFSSLSPPLTSTTTSTALHTVGTPASLPVELKPGEILGGDGVVRVSRTPEQIRSETLAKHPEGLDYVHALEQLVPMHNVSNKELRHSLKTSLNKALNGRFVLVLDGATGSSKRYTARLRCACREKPTTSGKGTSCKFSVLYELSTEGWVLVRDTSALNDRRHDPEQDQHKVQEGTGGYGRHNHPFHHDSIESFANAAGHCFNGEYLALGKLLGRAGQPWAQIHRAVNQKWADENGGPSAPLPPWNYKTVVHHCAPGRSGWEFDFSGLMTQLEDRRQAEGLAFYQDHDDTSNALNRLFVELRGAQEEWARGGDNNVLLFDPTYNTNRYLFKLCQVCTVCPSGKTVILAWCVLEKEGKNDFEWAFRCIAQTFKVAPAVIFTDHDAEIERAVTRMRDSGLWAGTHHHLCIFHLSKNLYERLRTHFLGDRGSERWRRVSSLFWKIAKTTDCSFRGLFDEAWAGLVKLVVETASNQDNEHFLGSVAWLKELGSLKERFVYAFTWGRCTLTLNSTGRIESIQFVSKGHMGMSGRTTLTELHDKNEMYNKESRRRHKVEDFRICGRHLRAAETLPAAVQALQPKVSSFAFAHLISQSREAMHYRHGERDHELADEPYILHRTAPSSVASTAGPRDENTAYVPEAEHACPDDNGLGDDPDTGRRVTVDIRGEGASKTLKGATCSCQFGISSGIGLCRHILCVCQVSQVQHIEIEALCIPKFLTCSEADVTRAVLRLGRIEPPRMQTDTSGGPCAADSEEKAPAALGTDHRARRLVLGSLTRRVMELGLLADAHFTVAETKLETLVDELSKLAVADGPKAARVGSRSTRSAPSIGPGTDTAERAPTEAVPTVYANLSVGLKKTVQDVLKNNYRVAQLKPLGEDTSEILLFSGHLRNEMVGRSILAKWEPCKKEGSEPIRPKNRWCIGTVVEAVEVANWEATWKFAGVEGGFLPNFRVHYEGEEAPVNQCLRREQCLNYVPHPNPGYGWWFLLEAKSLDAPTMHVRPPAQSRKRGRPESRRNKPVSGPCSDHHAKAQKLTKNKEAGARKKGLAQSPKSPKNSKKAQAKK